ncbi:MAG: hypothetical protein IJ794_04490, partial [Lachnospiraceae bacterium]|nr:hypothetical protein [Lachnospiraceae bacterium]
IGGISVMGIRTTDGTSIEIFGNTVTIHGVAEIKDFEDIKGEGFDFLDAFHIEDPFVLAGLNCFCAAIVIVMALAAVITIGKLFEAIEKSDTPFKKEILEKMKISGILVTVIALTSSIGTAVMAGLTFWCIYCIFDYGMELQKSADETL